MADLTQLAALFADGAVSTRPDDLDRYSHDDWPRSTKSALRGIHRYRPDAVVRPGSAAEIHRVLEWAVTHGVPVTPWGLGSSVTGAPLPLSGGITVDLSALNRIIGLDETDLTVTAEAGVRGDVLEAWLGERGYTLGHSPQSLDRSSVGGWLSTRATGQFSSRYGGIEDLVVGLTVHLSTGQTVCTPQHPRAAVGPDLAQLFLGAEGTLGIVSQATLKVFPQAETALHDSLRLPDVATGIEAMRLITRVGIRPYLVRYYDQDEARHTLGDPDFDGCLLMLGSAGVPAVAEAEQRAAVDIAIGLGGTSLGPDPVIAWLARRYDFSTIERRLASPGGYAETIEVAHTWSRIGALHADAKAALRPLADDVLGHFSHVYPQGTSLYLILLGTAADDAAAEQRIDDIWRAAMAVAQRHGAAISHHHGVGIARLPQVRRAMGDNAILLDRVKAALDPAGVLSPGKLAITQPAVVGAQASRVLTPPAERF